MLNEQELIQRQMEKTRGSLTEKLEALEGQVSETVTSTAGAVQDTTQSVQETVTGAVDAVKETVASVTDKVEETMSAVTDKFQETVQTVSDSFNLRVQVERHPWIVFGGAVAVGCWVGSSFGSDREIPATTPTASGPPPAPPPWNKAAPQSVASPHSETEEGGVWNGAISHLKDLGVSYLMGMVRDLAKRELPEVLGHRVADEVDALTTKMGTEPIPGSVLPEPEPEASRTDLGAGKNTDYGGKKGSTYRGRSPAGAAAI